MTEDTNTSLLRSLCPGDRVQITLDTGNEFDAEVRRIESAEDKDYIPSVDFLIKFKNRYVSTVAVSDRRAEYDVHGRAVKCEVELIEPADGDEHLADEL